MAHQWWPTLLLSKCAKLVEVVICTGQNWKGTVSETKYSTPHCLAATDAAAAATPAATNNEKY